MKTKDGKVILPKTANLADAQIELTAYSDEEDEEVVGLVNYTYGNRKVGSAKLLYTKDESGSYPFHNVDKSEGGSEVPYYRVDFLTIFGVAGAIVFGILFIVFVVKKTDELSTRLHRFRLERKDPHKGFHRIKKTKRRKRRRR